MADRFPVTEYFYFPCRNPKTPTDWRNVWDFCVNAERFDDYAEIHGPAQALALRCEQWALLDAYRYKRPRQTAKQKAESAERGRRLNERITREQAQARALAVVVKLPHWEVPVLPNGVRMCFGYEVEGSATFLDGRPAR